jgi:hypothetical protein
MSGMYPLYEFQPESRMAMRLFISSTRRSLFRILPAVMALVFFPGIPELAFSQSSPKNARQQRRVEILEKTGEYCRRLEKAALDFVCLEDVSERIDMSRDIIQSKLAFLWDAARPRIASRIEPVKVKKYRYDYQLVRKGGKIKESRILLEENSRRMYEEDADLKTSVFTFDKFLFGPIAVLSAENRQYYDFKIIKEETWDGEKVAVLEARPKPSLTQNVIFGKIWIRKRDFSILKMECNQKSIANFWILEERAKKYKADPEIMTIVEYGVEKNGVRFPSRCSIEEGYRNKKGKKFVRSETRVVYKNYKFFTVETETRFQ